MCLVSTQAEQGREIVACWACFREPELAVAEASLYDDAPVYDPAAAAAKASPQPVDPPTESELRIRRLMKEINNDNALQKARELEELLTTEIQNLETRLTPVEVELGE